MKRAVLMDGEVTGHAHVAVAEDAVVEERGGVRTLTAPSGTNIVHEEHKTNPLPPGKYTVSRQREIDPDTEQIRNVAD